MSGTDEHEALRLREPPPQPLNSLESTTPNCDLGVGMTPLLHNS